MTAVATGIEKNKLRLWGALILIGLSLTVETSGFDWLVDKILRVLGSIGLIWYGYKKKDLTASILLAMIVGVIFGYDFPEVAQNFAVIGKVFLKLIKTIVAPLLFATLVVGIAGHADLKQVGRMGVKALAYFEVVTTIALFIGIAAINITKVGEGIQMPQVTVNSSIQQVKTGWEDTILHVFPENIAKATAEGQVLQIVVFAVLFGIGTAMVGEVHRKRIIGFTESLAEVMFKFTSLVMYMAPLAVGAAIAYTVSQMGIDILKNLFGLLFTLYGALIAFLVLVLLPIAVITRVPIAKFVKAIAEPVSLAFATTSSEAALPKAMTAMEGLGVPRKIVAFVMPTGYSFNLDGTTLYLSLAAVFVAQAAGIELSWAQQLEMVFVLMLTSKGVAGVPRASLVILLATATTFGLPPEPIFLILGIDNLMDMARTSVNVIGNCLATWVVARWEGELPDQIADSAIAD